MEDLFKLKVTEIKKKCKDLGLSIAGNKTELTSRLLQHFTKGDDSVLNEAELLGELDSSDSQVVSNVDEDLLLGESTIEPREENNDKCVTKESQPVEKPEDVDKDEVAEPPAKILKPDVPVIDAVETTKKLDKTDEDKKQDRAARFGLSNTQGDDEKKLLRAQRFGIAISTNNGDSSIDIEKLKKRQERFGGSVSEKLNKVTDDEKKLKRAERFGFQSGVENQVKNNSSENKKSLRAARFGINNEEDKKKARAARFGK